MRVSIWFLGLLVLAVAGCSQSSQPTPNAGPPLTELKKEDLKVGSGEAVKKGDMVWVRYTGKFKDGRVFDGNDDPKKEPYSFKLGGGGVIAGWDEGIVGMRVGGKRHLSIPSNMGYGQEGSGQIPPNTDLYFDVELLQMMSSEASKEVKVRILAEGKGRECKVGDTVTIAYEGKTAEGKLIDSSEKQGGPISFTIGNNELMANGLEDAIVGMKVGEKRRIELPPGFGMPPGLAGIKGPTLQIFTVTLRSIK